MDALSLDEADIAAHSHGGAVAMMFAARHPGRVRRLILFAPANPFCDLGKQLIHFYQTRFGVWFARRIPFLPRMLKATALSRMYGDPSRVSSDALDGYTQGLHIPGTVDHVLHFEGDRNSSLRMVRGIKNRFGGADAFFCNSGAEAIEAALKWARKATGHTEFVALEGSFHGRTLGALSVTGQPAKRTAFEPLLPGAVFATPETLAEHVGPETAAILLEPVQGEGGVHPLSAETLAEARALADRHGAVLVFDEVQTGVGRCGSFFAWERLGVKPDALTLAKGLANGLPIGALLVGHDAPTAFEPGDHASTFGGNPVTCAAACAVVDTIDEDLLAHVRALSDRFAAALPNTRGLGLLLAVEVDGPVAPIVDAALARGLVIGTAGPTTLRLTPPLTLSTGEADQAISLLTEVLA